MEERVFALFVCMYEKGWNYYKEHFYVTWKTESSMRVSCKLCTVCTSRGFFKSINIRVQEAYVRSKETSKEKELVFIFAKCKCWIGCAYTLKVLLVVIGSTGKTALIVLLLCICDLHTLAHGWPKSVLHATVFMLVLFKLNAI